MKRTMFGHFQREQLVLLVVLILAIFSSACSAVAPASPQNPAILPVNYAGPLEGVLVSIRGGSVAYGVQQALAGAPGTTILQSGDKLVFVWGYANQSALAFFAIDTKGKTILDMANIIRQGGQMTNINTAEDFILYLKNLGWTAVTPAALATEIFWNTAAATCEAFGRLPLVFLYVDQDAGNFMQWYEDLYPSQKT